jgi:EAL domain-containing protein (putative c-di-GMP-specific phosphodiesterase class I)
MYKPIINVRENVLSGFKTEMVINDPYYGIVRNDMYADVAKRSGQIVKLEKFAIEKFLRELCLLNLHGVKIPVYIFEISINNLSKKTFAKTFRKALDKFGIVGENICSAVNEIDVIGREDILKDIITSVHDNGFLFGVDQFGEQPLLLSKLGSYDIDKIILSDSFGRQIGESNQTISVVSGMVKIIDNLEIDVIFGGIPNRTAEANIISMKGKYAYGKLYKELIKADEIEQYIKDVGGVRK